MKIYTQTAFLSQKKRIYLFAHWLPGWLVQFSNTVVIWFSRGNVLNYVDLCGWGVYDAHCTRFVSIRIWNTAFFPQFNSYIIDERWILNSFIVHQFTQTCRFNDLMRSYARPPVSLCAISELVLIKSFIYSFDIHRFVHNIQLFLAIK